MSSGEASEWVGIIFRNDGSQDTVRLTLLRMSSTTRLLTDKRFCDVCDVCVLRTAHAVPAQYAQLLYRRKGISL